MASSRGIKATEMIVKHLEKLDAPEEEPKIKGEEHDEDDLTLFDVSKDDTTLLHEDGGGDDDEDDEFAKLLG